jgi:uncharacterized repeat protein (TIGR03803 family)
MKTRGKNRFLLPSLVSVLCAVLARETSAQTFTTLYNFAKAISAGGMQPATNMDGAYPLGNLILRSNSLYGVASAGGVAGCGTVFKVNTDGTGSMTLVALTETNFWPQSPLTLAGNTLFGTTFYGGISSRGTVFAVNTNGTAFRTLTSFPGVLGGMHPQGALISSGDKLYGTSLGALSGGYFGAKNSGTVFALKTNGTGYTDLYTFTPLGAAANNSDGGDPYQLILSSNTLYGVAIRGGASGNGTIFKLNTDGTGFAVVHTFSATSSDPNVVKTNRDGVTPAGLILAGNTLYGTASFGGNSGFGTVFKVNTDGTAFTTLHNFPPTSGFYPALTNSDGAVPSAGLVLCGTALCGTATDGGRSGNGSIFRINTNGTGFEVLYNFSETTYDLISVGTNSDGVNPNGRLICEGDTLYGTTYRGGYGGNGTVFSYALPPPQLTIGIGQSNIVLSWPISTKSYTLESTTNLQSMPWATVPLAPVVVNGQNTVTNPISGIQQFFRLSQ